MTREALQSAMASPSAPLVVRTAPRGPARRSARAALSWTSGLALGATALVLGTALGLVLTAAALRNGEAIGAVTLGSWRLPVGEGTPAINPYQRAVLARTGAIPLSAGQGVAFTAVADASGRKLDRRCDYTVSGPVPRARYWTLAVADRSGFAIPNPADRYAFTSADVLRDEAGHFTVTVSPDVAPGNWLPLAGTGRFSLVLRLYDSAVPALETRELDALGLPRIIRGACR